jgi:hypothetical protein
MKDNPGDPACREFLHDASNKQPHSTIGACGQEPYHPGCPQILNPERVRKVKRIVEFNPQMSHTFATSQYRNSILNVRYFMFI